MNLPEIEAQVIELVKKVGTYIQGEKNSQLTIRNKDLHDFVTHVDIESERLLKEDLRKILPKASFLAEETEHAAFGNGLQWIIDPIDGTTNYIHSVPAYAISIALALNGESILGVVYNIPQNKLYHTTFTSCGRKSRI